MLFFTFLKSLSEVWIMVKKKTTIKKRAVKKKGTKTTKKGTKIAVKVAKRKASKTRKKQTKAVAKTIKRKKPVKKSATRKTLPRISKRERIIQEIKQTLISQREALLREAEEALNALPGEINFPDMGDQATAETDRNFMLRLRDRERMLLKKIDETIERIDNNSYGICSSCGNEIDIKRLEARPVTDLCIDCKIRQEEEEKITEG
jgi:DnaK suppressor protein